MGNAICMKTRKELCRGVRPFLLVYENMSVTVNLPGWYIEGEEGGVHSDADMAVSKAGLEQLRKRHLQKLRRKERAARIEPRKTPRKKTPLPVSSREVR